MIGETLDGPVCSRAGCRAEATWSILWRNPRIHTVERRKCWLACAEHADELHGFLTSRDFPAEKLSGIHAPTGSAR